MIETINASWAGKKEQAPLNTNPHTAIQNNTEYQEILSTLDGEKDKIVWGRKQDIQKFLRDSIFTNYIEAAGKYEWWIGGIQKLLKKAGYYNGSIDNNFELESLSALVRFQREKDITDERGTIWEKTLQALKANPAEKKVSAWAKETNNTQDFPSDGTMNEGAFRAKYGDFLWKLGNQLDFWNVNGKAFIMSIIHQETNFAEDLKHPEWSTGVMQLTKWPFADMKWETSKKWVFDAAKVSKYQKVFQKLDIDDLKESKTWAKETLAETLPEGIWQNLDTLTNPQTNPVTASNIINTLQKVEKWNRKDYYLHTLNMIIGSVYLKYIYDNKWKQNVWDTAFHYNGNPKLQAHYRNKVNGYYKEEQNIT